MLGSNKKGPAKATGPQNEWGRKARKAEAKSLRARNKRAWKAEAADRD